jgi:DNA invertase Pin-like site-specific DNA recombinase
LSAAKADLPSEKGGSTQDVRTPPKPLAEGPSSTNLSLSAQNDRFLHHCENNGYEAAAAFLDSDLSGARPGFQQLLSYLDEPEKGFVTVVIASFAHLGESPVAAARGYFQITARAAQIVSLTEGLLDDNQVLELWASRRAQSELGDKVRSAMRKRAVQGKALGRPPYGYSVGADRRLQVVEHEAEVVRYIFKLNLDGLGIRRIAKRLNEEGFRTRRDGRWSMVSLRDLLRNRAYLGTYARFGVKVPGNHPAIIRDADFKAVQEATERRRTNPSPAKGSGAVKAKPSQFLLSGLVYCADTNAKMIGVTRRQRWTRRDGEVAQNTYRYYQSEARTNQSVGDYHTRRADDLEAEVVKHLTGDTPGAVQPVVLTAGDADAIAAEIANAQSRIQGRLRGVEKRLQDHLDSAARGAVPRDEVRTTANDLVHEFQQAQDELAGLQRRSAAQSSEDERRRYREQQLSRLRGDWESLPFDERQALLRDIIEKIVVDVDGVRTILRA